MKRLSFLFAAFAAPVLAGPVDSETFVWKDCPPEIKVHAIREFMEIAVRDDLVVYSAVPGRLSGVCGRAKVPDLRARLAAEARAAAGRAAPPAETAEKKKPAAAPSGRVCSFTLAELLDPDREIWLVRRFVAEDGRADDDPEPGADAVVFFGGTDKQGSVVAGQRLRGLLVPSGVYTVTNDYRRAGFGDDGWERRRNVERLRRYTWRADRPEGSLAAPSPEPSAAKAAPAPQEVYFRTFGINYLNADHVFPLWLRSRGGSFKTTVRTQKTCEKCGGKGRWSEWKSGSQQLVSCPACAGNGTIDVRKTYEFVPEGPNARRNVPFK